MEKLRSAIIWNCRAPAFALDQAPCPSISVAEAAALCGYDNPLYFSRV